MSGRVKGVPALLDRFQKAAALGEVAANAARDALGEEVATGARREVAVDTGETRDSISYADGSVTATSEAAFYLEYGTSDTDAQPFMRPAADTVDDSPALGIAADVMDSA